MKGVDGGRGAVRRPGRTSRRGQALRRALAGTCLTTLVVAGPAMAAAAVVPAAPALAAVASTLCEQSPQQPTLAAPSLTATPGDAQITLNWTAPEHTEYTLCQAATPDYTKGVQVETTTLTSDTVPSLVNGTTYYFWVIADVKPNPPMSAIVQAIPRTVPGSPTTLTVTPGHSRATLSWAAPASDGGAPVTSYRVYEGTTADFTDGTPAATANGTSAPVTGLTDGRTYFFRVTAVNAAGEGAPSGEASTTLPSDTVPGPPTGLTAAVGDSRVILTWTAPASDGGAPVTGYVVYKTTDPAREAGVPVSNSPVPGTSYTVTGLAAGTTYYFTVAAVNSVGVGSPSGEAAATLPTPSSPAPSASSSPATSPAPPSSPATATPTAVKPTPGPVSRQLVAVLAAIAAAALAGVLTLVTRGRRAGTRRDQPIPAPDVRAVPDTSGPGTVSVRDTGTEPTHTVRLEPDYGTTTTTIKERS